MTISSLIATAPLCVPNCPKSWRDLTAKKVTWDTLNSEPGARDRLTWVGFPLIAVGTMIQIVGVAITSGS